MRLSPTLLLPLALAACSLFVPSATEGEGDVGGEGEGDVGEGEGDVVGEGEGDVVGEGEGDVGEGEGDVVGEGEGDNVGCNLDVAQVAGFADEVSIRACAGHWTRAGLQLSGVGSASDLCAVGWHICLSDAEVKEELGDAPCTPSEAGFFATMQGGDGGRCPADGFGANDLIGCAIEAAAVPGGCRSLNGIVGFTDEGACAAVDGFGCAGTNGFDEVLKATHVSGPGGVLCCRDSGAVCDDERERAILAEADATVVTAPVDASHNSHGLDVALEVDASSLALVRFASPALYDAALTSGELALTAIEGDLATDVAAFNDRNSPWVEFRDTCDGQLGGSTDCDGVDDGVSGFSPVPATSNGPSPWNPTLPLGAVVGTSVAGHNDRWTLPVSALRGRFELFERPAVLSLAVESADADAVTPIRFASLDGGALGAPPQLILRRCFKR